MAVAATARRAAGGGGDQPDRLAGGGGPRATRIELNETLISPNKEFTVNYPEGWVTGARDWAAVLANSPEALANVNNPLTTGQVGIFIWFTAAEAGRAATVSVAGKSRPQMLKALLAKSDATIAEGPTEITVGASKATRFRLNVQGTEALMLAIATGRNIVSVLLAGAAAGEMAEFEPTIMAIAATLTYRGPPPGQVGAPDEGRHVASTAPVSEWAIEAEASSEFGKSSWSAWQATGPPECRGVRDNSAAWASADSTGEDTLTVRFQRSLIATEVRIHQSYTPGAITSVALIPADGGNPIVVPNSADPDKTCPHVFTLKLSASTPVDGVAIHLDQSLTGNWNEIDAVQLVGAPAGQGLTRQWATGAEASSEYGADNWSAMQATGQPNTTGCGDSTSAWASRDSEGKDTLALHYDHAVTPTEIDIYQSNAPGAITSVEVLPADGSGAQAVPHSADPNTTCPHVFKLKLPPGMPPVNGVVIHVDQSLTGDWNEIDAVELLGQ